MSEALELALTSMQERCSTNMAKYPGEPFSVKSYQSISSLAKEGIPDISDNISLGSWIRRFAQVALDVTFCEENVLVENEFPESGGFEKLTDIIDCLDSTEKFLGEIFENDRDIIKNITGEEILECIYWRKGALCYMYCSTIKENEERLSRSRDIFIKVCRNGVKYLQSMLNVRKLLKESRSEVLANDDSVFQLIQNGIYSDTHMLALMYCGEMCVWCSQYCGDDSCVRTQTDLGIRCLQTFCEMVSGPLKGKGWTATQAHSYLGKLKTLCSSLNE